MTEPLPNDALHAQLAELTDRTLSRSGRYGHLALTVVATVMAACLAGLLFTEPDMPKHVMVAFSVMFAITSAWAAFGARVLSRRRPLLANREVVAGGMAVAFSALFTIAAALIGILVGGHTMVTSASILGATLTLVAIAVLVRALLRRAELRALRARLERELAAP